MVREGDLCSTCGVGTMHPFSHGVDKGLVEAPYRTEGAETGFQCDNPDCGAKWNKVSRTLASKYKVESRNPKKQDAKPKAKTKGGIKKMKNTDGGVLSAPYTGLHASNEGGSMGDSGKDFYFVSTHSRLALSTLLSELAENQ